jgi:hypothetical protein
MKVQIKNNMIYIFVAVLIIFLLWNYFNKMNNKEGMEISTGGMMGYVKRQIHPITRPIVRKVKDSFTNPTMEYYTNKINQIFI